MKTVSGDAEVDLQAATKCTRIHSLLTTNQIIKGNTYKTKEKYMREQFIECLDVPQFERNAMSCWVLIKNSCWIINFGVTR